MSFRNEFDYNESERGQEAVGKDGAGDMPLGAEAIVKGRDEEYDEFNAKEDEAAARHFISNVITDWP